MPNGTDLTWFDAHLDLAYLAEMGRDMHAELDDCRGKLLPAAVTLPAMAKGAVTDCLATVFTEPLEAGGDPSGSTAGAEAAAYPAGDALAARRAGLRQLKLYQAWRGAGAVRSLGDEGAGPLRLGVLVENADPIESPEYLDEWVEGGVVAVGLTWVRRGRYASGNGVPSTDPDSGLTEAGRDLVRALDEAGVVHDLSHLNDRSLEDVLSCAQGRVIASHSNARALLGGENQRHLTDTTIAEIARRGGVIGVNLYGGFLTTEDRRATIDDVVRQIVHICDVVGDRRHIGLGSDMDGGFSADKLPEGLDRPDRLTRLAEALGEAGWADQDVAGFANGNWSRFWAETRAGASAVQSE